MNPVILPRPLVNDILQQALAAPEREICGLIGARDGHPTRCYPVENSDPQPGHHFHMDPRQQIAAMRAMRENHEALFAIYHSHPDAPPIPSTADIREAAYEEALYLIVSLATEGTLQLRGFRIHDGRAEAVDFEVE